MRAREREYMENAMPKAILLIHLYIVPGCLWDSLRELGWYVSNRMDTLGYVMGTSISAA